MTIEIPTLEQVKAKQQAAWSSGDYAIVGTTLQIVGEELAESLDLRSGQIVLDVAAGNGNFTLAAARRWTNVTSTDYVQSLLDKGRQRAQAEGLAVNFQVADAENLPFDDQSVDVTASTFGVMFTPNQAKAAQELARVTRSGGKIGLANWTPDSFIGKLFKTIGKYLPPPQGVQSPALWGTEEHLQNLFSETAADIQIAQKDFVFRYRSADHWMQVFREFYGPTQKAFAALDEQKQKELATDILALLRDGNRANDGTLVLPSNYLEVVITKA